VLEIGPGWLPVVKDADLMLAPDEDQFGRPDFSGGKSLLRTVYLQSSRHGPSVTTKDENG